MGHILHGNALFSHYLIWLNKSKIFENSWLLRRVTTYYGMSSVSADFAKHKSQRPVGNKIIVRIFNVSANDSANPK